MYRIQTGCRVGATFFLSAYYGTLCTVVSVTKHMRKVLAAIGIVGVIIAAALMLGVIKEADVPADIPSGTGIGIGDLAPDFTLSTLDGETASLSDYRGTAVMLDFWAAWCPFCTNEFPVMQQAYERFGDEGFVILGIHRTDTESEAIARRFIDKTGVTFPILLDVDDEIYRTFVKVRAMPASVFIDREGVIRSRIFGPKQLNTLEDEIQKIL